MVTYLHIWASNCICTLIIDLLLLSNRIVLCELYLFVYTEYLQFTIFCRDLYLYYIQLIYILCVLRKYMNVFGLFFMYFTSKIVGLTVDWFFNIFKVFLLWMFCVLCAFLMLHIFNNIYYFSFVFKSARDYFTSHGWNVSSIDESSELRFNYIRDPYSLCLNMGKM